MKKLITSLLLITSMQLLAQVGIGTASPDPSSLLDITSTSKGLLLPRMTTTQRLAIVNPAQGLMVFNTESSCFETYRGTSWLQTCGVAACTAVPSATTALTQVPGYKQITWNWSAVSGAIGYKYNAANNYGTAIDIGPLTTYNQLVCAAGATSLFVWAYNLCGASTAFQLPSTSPATTVAAITGSSSVCSVSGTTQLNNSTVGGTWSSSDITLATVNSIGVVTGVAPTTAVTITYSVTSSCGGSSSATQNVTVNSSPMAISGPTIATIGIPATLNAAPIGGVWTTSNATVATVSIDGKVSGNTAGTVGISYALNGCSATQSIAVVTCPSITVVHTTAKGAPINTTITYNTVLSTAGGTPRCWLEKNLGATTIATSLTDPTTSSIGWFYQFGVKQGYALIAGTRTPATQWVSNSQVSTDWPTAFEPCINALGSDWRLPTSSEWASFVGSFASANAQFASALKLHKAGILDQNTGNFNGGAFIGTYWGSTLGNITNSASAYSVGSNQVVPTSLPEGDLIRCVRIY